MVYDQIFFFCFWYLSPASEIPCQSQAVVVQLRAGGSSDRRGIVPKFTAFFLGDSKPTSIQGECQPRVLKSRINEDEGLIKAAEKACRNQQVQDDINSMEEQIRQGNINPGIGSKPVGEGITEFRGTKGGRILIRESDFSKPIRREVITKDVNKIMRQVSTTLPEKPNITSHSFRIGYITKLWKDTKNIEFVKQTIGHRRLDTTSAYVQSLSDQERKEGIEKLE